MDYSSVEKIASVYEIALEKQAKSRWAEELAKRSGATVGGGGSQSHNLGRAASRYIAGGATHPSYPNKAREIVHAISEGQREKGKLRTALKALRG